MKTNRLNGIITKKISYPKSSALGLFPTIVTKKIPRMKKNKERKPINCLVGSYILI
tara:strand:+ start:325 stop:492 length:168 start_codon:yes stop_codon:yes gene_type:complete